MSHPEMHPERNGESQGQHRAGLPALIDNVLSEALRSRDWAAAHRRVVLAARSSTGVATLPEIHSESAPPFVRPGHSLSTCRSTRGQSGAYRHRHDGLD